MDIFLYLLNQSIGLFKRQQESKTLENKQPEQPKNPKSKQDLSKQDPQKQDTQVGLPPLVPSYEMWVKNCDCHTTQGVMMAFCMHLGMNPIKAERKMLEIHEKGQAYIGKFHQEAAEHFRDLLTNRTPGNNGEPMELQFIPELPPIDNSDMPV